MACIVGDAYTLLIPSVFILLEFMRFPNFMFATFIFILMFFFFCRVGLERQTPRRSAYYSTLFDEVMESSFGTETILVRNLPERVNSISYWIMDWLSRNLHPIRKIRLSAKSIIVIPHQNA